MKKSSGKWGLVALIVLGLLLSACSSPAALTATPDGGMMATQTSSIPPTGNEIDEMFTNMMVPHHQGAVEMAKIALERSQRPEIQAMANDIIASQSQEITTMKEWKQAWYGSADTPDMSEMPMLVEMPGMGAMGHTMDMQAEVDALRSAAEPFDLAFIDAMIPHHQSAIDAASMVVDTAVHPEVKDLAQQIIDAQQKEIEQMRQWRQQWYPDAPAQ